MEKNFQLTTLCIGKTGVGKSTINNIILNGTPEE